MERLLQLTDISIRALKAPERGQKTFFDDVLTGFGVRVSQGGTKTFVLMHRKDRKLMTIGRVGIIKLKDAREKAKDILAEKQLHGDTFPSPKFEESLKRFFKLHCVQKNKPSTAADAGDGFALAHIGCMYEFGHGVPKDEEQTRFG